MMKLYFQRLNKKGEEVSLSGELFVDSGNKFTFHFDHQAKDIVLNDGKAHNRDTLTGTITEWWMDRERIVLRVFVDIGGAWHPDQLGFCFNG